ncbi:hypothetical protein [Deinococcus aetherius]|uniref:hypothetical protein n=1 Tax=Deinococcus aetherius TaxID=200252 RepID=UPI00222E59A4|nr:hypothetical protein [Deinococcus aetherius]
MVTLEGLSAFLNEEGEWESPDAALAHLLTAFCDFYSRTYGPEKGFWQGHMLRLMEDKLGVAVEAVSPTREEVEAPPDRVY